jgi:hypothetical protein
MPGGGGIGVDEGMLGSARSVAFWSLTRIVNGVGNYCTINIIPFPQSEGMRASLGFLAEAYNTTPNTESALLSSAACRTVCHDFLRLDGWDLPLCHDGCAGIKRIK